MKIPAIRAQIGIWVYYISTLSFEQVDKYVQRVDDELHKSELLREMLQRSITENYKSIADYIAQQEERFFNALILAVYDGEPKWNEIRLEYDNGEEFYDLGILELTGNEKIFPVDGQHRVEGIKKAIFDNCELSSEKIPVVFIGHKKTEEGMRRARRMFSTLNRYAKPVSLSDIIALDEDDSVAIACRDLIDNNSFFANNRILNTKSKAIPPNNQKEFTTIITFYECNRELLDVFINDFKVYDENSETGKMQKLKGRRKIERYIRFRPDEGKVNDFIRYCNSFWDNISEYFPKLKDYKDMHEPDCKKYRHKDGGDLFFRPVALFAIIHVCAVLKKQRNYDYEDSFQLIERFPLELASELWENVLWEPVSKKMLTTNQSMVIDILLYCIDKTLLNDRQIEKLKTSIKGAKQISDEEVESLLDKYMIG